MSATKSTAQRRMLPCQCHDDHFLAFTTWEGHVEAGAEVSVGGSFGDSWRTRARRAWNVLRGGHTDLNVGVLLSADQARELAVELLAFHGRLTAPEDTGTEGDEDAGD